MKKFRNLLLVALFFVTATILGQTKISGTVVDDLGEPLPGASVVEKGTSNGTATDFDGKFMLNTTSNSGVVVVSFVGFAKKEVSFTGSNLGKIQLEADANTLEEVVIVGKGVVDLVKDRQTPIAATTIRAADIQEKLGNQEFPEALKTVPGVYPINTGGYGDGSYTVRGFDQANVLVLINGQPVNDMEWGGIYWSNWSGLSDVASVVQQQRGLGSSKVGIASVGGTTNIVTKASDRRQGGFIKGTLGNDSFYKTTLSYSTGLGNNGWAASALISYWQGDGYMDATQGKGGTYFLSIGHKLNERHAFNFTVTGAPQWHDQDYREKISTYEKYGYQYNSNWGYLNGRRFTFSRNFYHKPIANLNWDWNISEKLDLSTVLYGSWGLGGGTGTFGVPHYKLPDDKNGLIRVDDLVKSNQGISVDGFKPVLGWGGNDNPDSYWTGRRVITKKGPGTVRRASINEHSWYGALSNLDYEINDNFNFSVGLDLRTYTAKHYRVLTDLLGADAYYDTANVSSAGNFVNRLATPHPLWVSGLLNAQKVDRNFDSHVRWAGLFTQLEYSNESISAFIQASASNQAYKREEFFTVLANKGETDWFDIWGGNVKGGLNYKITNEHNVYANVGYYSRQPFFANLFPYKYTPRANERIDLDNEQVIGYELGYGFHNAKFDVNLNLYRTEWDNRLQNFNADVNGKRQTVQGLIGQVHQGAELELKARPTEKLQISGLASYGDWKYSDDVTGRLYNDLGQYLGEAGKLYLNDVEVGGSPQMQLGLGAKYELYDLLEGLSVDADWFYNAKNFAKINAKGFTSKDNKNLEMPSYNVLDAGISYKLKFNNLGGVDALKFRLNVKNVLDELYIARGYSNKEADADASKNWKGINKSNTVEFGFGRTWSASVTFEF